MKAQESHARACRRGTRVRFVLRPPEPEWSQLGESNLGSGAQRRCLATLVDVREGLQEGKSGEGNEIEEGVEKTQLEGRPVQRNLGRVHSDHGSPCSQSFQDPRPQEKKKLRFYF